VFERGKCGCILYAFMMRSERSERRNRCIFYSLEEVIVVLLDGFSLGRTGGFLGVFGVFVFFGPVSW